MCERTHRPDIWTQAIRSKLCKHLVRRWPSTYEPRPVFTLHCVDESGHAVLRTNLRRAQMLTFFKNLAPAEIALEACGSSHHWARELTALGHVVRLIPPQYVKPFIPGYIGRA